MKRLLIAVLYLLLTAVVAKAQMNDPTQIIEDPGDQTGGGGVIYYDLVDHGGPKIAYGRLVYIFWGTLPSGYAAELQAYRDEWGGMNEHLGMLAQYNAPQSSLTGSQADVFDPANPSAINVTDAMIRAEITRLIPGGSLDTNTIYAVVLPNGYYASNGTQTSCGGDNLQFCAYHSYYTPSTAILKSIKYAVIPYQSCPGCRIYDANGHTASEVQSVEVFVLHEVREALTDPKLNAWYDQFRQEADDKCQMYINYNPHPENVFYTITPSGPLDTPYYHPGHTFWFQKEYSNEVHGCVQ